MKRKIIETENFSKVIDGLIRKHKLLPVDFAEFKKNLAKNPEEGDIIPGAGGMRKTRLKSASKGKKGGFRVCYIDDPENEELFLVLIYPKNEQENITPAEKKALKEMKNIIFLR